MTGDVIERLEEMRYKYLSMTHESMPDDVKEIVEEIIKDMALICRVLQRLLDPLADSK